MKCVGGRREVHTEFWWRNPRAQDHLEALGVGGRKIIKMGLQGIVVDSWTGFIWLRIGTFGGLL